MGRDPQGRIAGNLEQQGIQEDTALGVGVARVKITKAHYEGEYRIRISFDIGESGIVDLRDDIFRYRAAEPLRSPESFARFRLDEWPTIAWDCGFDLAPEYLYERVTGKSPAWALGIETEGNPEPRSQTLGHT